MSTPDTVPVSLPLDLQAWERLARAATPGPWTVRRHPALPSFVQAPRLDPTHPYDIEILGDDHTLYSTREADAEFVAACSPERILGLIAAAQQQAVQEQDREEKTENGRQQEPEPKGDSSMSDTAVAVWEGSFRIFGVDVKCATLSDGRRIIDADSFEELMRVMQAPDNDADLGDLSAFNSWKLGVDDGR